MNKKDAKKLFELRLKRAGEGEISAQASVGAFFRSGYGTDKDLKEALKWLRSAFQGNDAFGAFQLAEMYDSGEGVECDHSQAHQYFLKAVDFDKSSVSLNPEVRLSISKRLFEMFRDGIGTDKDAAAAKRWEDIYLRRKQNPHDSLHRTLKVDFSPETRLP